MKVLIARFKSSRKTNILLFVLLVCSSLNLAFLSSRFGETCFPADDSLFCADLELQNLRLVKEDRKCYFLSAELKNKGKTMLSLQDVSRLKLIVQSHYSGDQKLNKGDILADGFFLKRKLSQNINPGKSILVEFAVSKRKKNDYLGYLIVQADASNVLAECNELNNLAFLELPY